MTDGAKIASGYAYEADPAAWGDDYLLIPNDEWETVIYMPNGAERLLGFVKINGSDCAVFHCSDGLFRAQSVIYARDSQVSPPDSVVTAKPRLNLTRRLTGLQRAVYERERNEEKPMWSFKSGDTHVSVGFDKKEGQFVAHVECPDGRKTIYLPRGPADGGRRDDDLGLLEEKARAAISFAVDDGLDCQPDYDERGSQVVFEGTPAHAAARSAAERETRVRLAARDDDEPRYGGATATETPTSEEASLSYARNLDRKGRHEDALRVRESVLAAAEDRAARQSRETIRDNAAGTLPLDMGDLEDALGHAPTPAEVQLWQTFRAAHTPASHRYQVQAGNVGTVCDGQDENEARRIYSEYVETSKSGAGRVGGESVTLFQDEEEIAAHEGEGESEVKHPGKFEGSGAIGARLHAIVGDGMQDDECGSVDSGHWYGLILDSGVAGAEHAVVSEDSQGFFDFSAFPTAEAARADFDRITEEVAEDEEDEEEEEDDEEDEEEDDEEEAFTYHVDLNKRGEFRASVQDPDGENVFLIVQNDDNPSALEDVGMRGMGDLEGLRRHLVEIGIIQPGGRLTRV